MLVCVTVVLILCRLLTLVYFCKVAWFAGFVGLRVGLLDVCGVGFEGCCGLCALNVNWLLCRLVCVWSVWFALLVCCEWVWLCGYTACSCGFVCWWFWFCLVTLFCVGYVRVLLIGFWVSLERVVLLCGFDFWLRLGLFCGYEFCLLGFRGVWFYWLFTFWLDLLCGLLYCGCLLICLGRLVFRFWVYCLVWLFWVWFDWDRAFLIWIWFTFVSCLLVFVLCLLVCMLGISWFVY